MQKMFKIVWFISFIFLGITGCEKDKPGEELPDEIQKETHHPFLIVKKDMYPALRQKASREPWKSMKADALNRSGKGSDNDAYHLQEYIGAAALAYILDEGNESIHAERVKNAIVNKYATLDIQESSDWGKVVKPMGSFFTAILALDIVYETLSIEAIQACENVIRNQIFKVKRTGSWVDVRYGTHGTWDIYKGDMTEPNDAYYNGIMNQITPDGVSPVTNHYAWERVGGGNSRVSKAGFMDVLEFTGIDNRYYNNERLQKFHRWLFGSSINCAKEMAIFGDMLPNQGIGNYMLHRRVVNFDAEAAGYAAWYLNGVPAIGHILTYVLPKQELPEPVVPASKFYENGGAFFRETADDPIGLHGVLYNIKSQDEWHTHNEVNGLALSGLGNRLLVNGGRLGAPTRAAYLNNTLTINGINHDSRLGGGITTGFIAKGLDFAVGNDGPSLSSETHDRNLIMIHGDEEVNGYFIVFDEVKGKAGDKIKNYLHPANQSIVTQTLALSEYTAPIDHYETLKGTSITFYYLTPPTVVNVDKTPGAVPDRYPGYPDHNRLEAVYDINSEGSKNLATLIFPHDFNHPKADFQKISTGEFHGVIANQDGTSDFILESMAEKEITSNEISFNADLCVVRKSQKANSFYLVRNGTKLLTEGAGFDSDSEITIYANGNEGAIITNGATVKIKGKGIENVKFDPVAQLISSGKDFIEVQLSEGTYYFK